MRKINHFFAIVFTLCLLVAVQPSLTCAATTDNASQVAQITNKVNINSANLDNLTQLPGIGKKTAQRIIDFRKANGNFKNPEDILNVKGIGQKKFDKLKSLLTV